MKDTVQLHVDVSRELWKSIKQSALDGGDTLKGVVAKALERSFSVPVKAEPKNESGGVQPGSGGRTGDSTPPTEAIPQSIILTDPPKSKCRKCFEVFPVSDLITEPKTGKLFCADCVENMKNGQA